MESGVSLSTGGEPQSLRSGLEPLLQKTSRTFALTIPLLPDPLRTEVAVAYLLFRIIDTFEDATLWSGGRRADALGQFVRLIDDGDLHGAQDLTAQWLRDPPLQHPGYLELLAATPRVLEWCRELRPSAREQLRLHVGRSARGMADVVARAGDQGSLQLQTMQELRDYCYTVAGIVGEMLTELFLLQSPALLNAAVGLRERAVAFGEGLQLVNILKDARPDAGEGRVYLPRQASLAEVFMLARADLRRAAEYTDLLRAAGGAPGLVAFNALNSRLAIGTLRVLRDQGLGAKLTRLQVTTMAAQVMNAVETGGVLFPDLP
jgi:farnesyl-diphosphate farnesyltransferase